MSYILTKEMKALVGIVFISVILIFATISTCVIIQQGFPEEYKYIENFCNLFLFLADPTVSIIVVIIGLLLGLLLIIKRFV